MPKSWQNGGRGGICFDGENFVAYSGEHALSYGKKLHFDFDILVTPVKPLAKNESKTEAVTVFSGDALTPYLNYPFTNAEELSRFIRKSHSDGKRVRVQYSLNEFPKCAPEYAPFSDFDCELIDRTVEESDVFALANGESRISNFYTEGLNYLVEKLDIDGIYLDGTALDRNTIKRARKILDKRDGAVIELHVRNLFTKESGYANAILTYSELLPYVDVLSFDSESKSTLEYRLIELNGFGIKS